jgi:hypothetical protein
MTHNWFLVSVSLHNIVVKHQIVKACSKGEDKISSILDHGTTVRESGQPLDYYMSSPAKYMCLLGHSIILWKSLFFLI